VTALPSHWKTPESCGSDDPIDGRKDVVWPQFIAIALIGVTFFGIALARFRRTIGSMA
jgi:hypothetical protein